MPEQTQIEVQQIIAMRRQEAEASRNRERQLEARMANLYKAREEVERKVQEYQDQCGALQRDLRRVGSVETRAHYRTFVTMQVRMAGAMHQAVTRAKAMDRVVTAAKAEAEDRRLQEERELSERNLRETEKQVAHLQLPQPDDLELLYGEVTDAAE